MPHRHRDQILEYLRLAASQADQLEYERSVPIADVPAEMISMFADDLFQPTHVGFSPEEAKELAEFYGRLCLASEAMDRSGVGSAVEMLKLPEWRSAMEFAKNLVSRLDRDG